MLINKRKSAWFVVLILFFLTITTLAHAQRLPTVYGDNNSWGTILNGFLNVSLDQNGTLRDDTVNTSQLIDTAITAEKIVDDAVNTTHIIDSTITASDLSSESINASHITSDAINSTHILDLTITASDIGNAVITAAKLVSGVITAAYIATNAVNTTHILDRTILGIDLADDIINTSHIVNGSITGDDIASQTINSTHILTGTLNSSALAPDSVNSTHILNNTIVGEDISSSADLNVSSINASVFYLGLETVTSDCSSLLCTTSINCPSGKMVIFGLTSSSLTTCDTIPLNCNSYCTPGIGTCEITSTVSAASIYAVCAKVA